MLFCLLAPTGKAGPRPVVLPVISVLCLDYGWTRWTGDRAVAKPCLYTDYTNKEETETNIHVASRVGTRDPIVQTVENETRIRPRGHRHQLQNS